MDAGDILSLGGVHGASTCMNAGVESGPQLAEKLRVGLCGLRTLRPEVPMIMGFTLLVLWNESDVQICIPLRTIFHFSRFYRRVPSRLLVMLLGKASGGP